MEKNSTRGRPIKTEVEVDMLTSARRKSLRAQAKAAMVSEPKFLRCMVDQGPVFAVLSVPLTELGLAQERTTQLLFGAYQELAERGIEPEVLQFALSATCDISLRISKRIGEILEMINREVK